MMSKVNRFDITLSSATGIYHPGETLSGQVTIKAREDIPVNGIHILVYGQAEASWGGKPGGRPKYQEFEIYLKDCLTVWGKAPLQKNPAHCLTLQAGGHEFSFEYKLPKRLPTTFYSTDEPKGRIHYIVRARIDSPDDAARQIKDKVFIVISGLDLNKEPKLSECVEVRKENQAFCCSCKTGPVWCLLRLDRTGFVPGEDINLNAEIHNLSRKEVTGSYVTMQQVVHFHAQGTSTSTTSDIFRISAGKINPGDSALYHDIIHIPPLPPSRLDGCTIIDVEYLIVVGVLPYGLSSPMEAVMPIIIGTVPLKHCIPCDSQVAPSYSRYSHSSGEIEDYEEEDYKTGKYQNVYTYYKSLYRRAESVELNEVT